jgi:hypothetical protein
MNNKAPRIFEYIWLVTSILALFTSLYSTLRLGVKNSIMMYVITMLAFAMYFMRRRMGKQNK